MSLKISDKQSQFEIDSNSASHSEAPKTNTNLNAIFEAHVSGRSSPTSDECDQMLAELRQQLAELEKQREERGAVEISNSKPSPNLELAQLQQELEELRRINATAQNFSEPSPDLELVQLQQELEDFRRTHINEDQGFEETLAQLRQDNEKLDQELIQLNKNIEELREKPNRVTTLICDQDNLELKRLKTISKIAQFYNIVLDSYPNLHPFIRGSADNHLLEMSQDIQSFLEHYDNSLSDEEKERLNTCSQQLIQADAYALSLKTEFKQTVQNIHNAIANLSDKESMIFKGSAEGHSFLYQIKKEGEKYLFIIINTGDDENILGPSGEKVDHKYRNFSFDHSYLDADHHKCYRASDKAYRCSLDSLSCEFITGMFSSETEELPMADIILQIDSAMMGTGAERAHGRPHHQGGRPSCSIKCVTSWLKGELVNHPELLARFKVFRTEKRCKELEQFENTVDHNLLEYVYQIDSNLPPEERLKILKEKHLERDAAVQAVYQKRLEKLTRYAQTV